MDNKTKNVIELHRLWLVGSPDGKKANLRRADLRGASLHGANLHGANLHEASLRGADLREADLREANLCRADLYGADLRGANLYGADLREAIFYGADLYGAKLPHFQIPQEGSIIGWKALKNGKLCKLQIPKKARRTASIVSRKCRAEYAKVLQIVDNETGESVDVGFDKHTGSTKYKKGKIVRPDSYDDDIRIECTNGIHFFITREEAKEWL